MRLDLMKTSTLNTLLSVSRHRWTILSRIICFHFLGLHILDVEMLWWTTTEIIRLSHVCSRHLHEINTNTFTTLYPAKFRFQSASAIYDGVSLCAYVIYSPSSHTACSAAWLENKQHMPISLLQKQRDYKGETRLIRKDIELWIRWYQFSGDI